MSARTRDSRTDSANPFEDRTILATAVTQNQVLLVEIPEESTSSTSDNTLVESAGTPDVAKLLPEPPIIDRPASRTSLPPSIYVSEVSEDVSLISDPVYLAELEFEPAMEDEIQLRVGQLIDIMFFVCDMVDQNKVSVPENASQASLFFVFTERPLALLWCHLLYRQQLLNPIMEIMTLSVQR
jgi:hypothetical protein